MQDDEVGRERRLQETFVQQKKANTVKDVKNVIISLLDVIAFVGGAWYVLTRFIFGPIANMFETDLFVADVDTKAIQREFSGELAKPQTN